MVNGENSELMIANMINALNNPRLVGAMSSDEIRLVLEVVKNHIVANAQKVVSEEQSRSLGSMFR